MLNIEQILDIIDIPNFDIPNFDIPNFDKADFLLYVKYIESNVKTIPPNSKPYYRSLYNEIKTIMRSRL
jgi:hypothetical protein